MRYDLNKRVWEIDAARGLCVLGMVVIHFIYDLNWKLGSNIPVFGLNYGSAFFILICGISSLFSRSNIKRGLYVLLLGLGITVVSRLYFIFIGDSDYSAIYFGILHLLGTLMILYHLVFRKLNNVWIIILTALILAAWPFLGGINLPHLWLFGITDNNFASYDYFPLIPHTAYFLIGVIIGRTVYKEKKSRAPYIPAARPLIWMGLHTLVIYLVHQPLFLGVMYVYELLIR